MKKTSLDKPADIRIVHILYRDGLLNSDAFLAANKILRPNSSWFSWARRMLLFLGAALVIAGIIFFFAYNWTAMGRFLKFGLIGAGITGCILAAQLEAKTRLGGKILLLSASVLVGVLLAVYGQIYQTGADTYELFIGWAVLIFGWVVVSEFAALWLIWLIVLNTGTVLYWFQVGYPAHEIHYEYLCLALALLNGLSLALREAGWLSGLEWLKGSWLRSILLTGFLVALSVPAIHLIVGVDDINGATAFCAGVWLFAAVCGYVCYRNMLPDMVSLAIIVMNACIILLILIGKILFYNTGYDEGGIFLVFALIILGVFSGAAFWLRETAATMVNTIRESA